MGFWNFITRRVPEDGAAFRGTAACRTDPRAGRRGTGPVFRTGAACALAAAFVLMLGAGAAQAQTSVKLVGNNVSGTRHDGNLVWDRAVAFTTGSHTHGYKLTRLNIRMRSTGATLPTYTVSIHSDSSGLPGTSLGTLTNPTSIPTSNSWVEFTASGNGIDLAKDTTYWIVMDRTGGDGLNALVRITTSDNEDADSSSGWSIANERRDRPGSTWDQTHTLVPVIAIYGYDKTAPVVRAVPDARERMLERTLASVASRTVSGALDTLGGRMGKAVPASGLKLGGLSLAGLNSAGPAPVGRPAPSGPDDAWPSGGGHGRGMTPDALLGSGAFSYTLGAAPEDKEGEKASGPNAPRWGIWGRGDFGTFAGRTSDGSSDGPEGGSRHDGDLRTGWLGADARGTRGPGRWVAGLAVSRGTSRADYVLDGEQGRIETDLTAFWPYGRWTFPDGLEMRGLLGVGRGEARHTSGNGPEEKSDLSMWAASAGFSRPLPPLRGIDLSARGDASLAFMETGHGDETVDGLSADVARVRGGVEASKRIVMADGASLTPFAEVTGRMDAGDGPAGPGIELAGGVRYAASRVAVELRGRWLATHMEKGAEEKGVSLTARLDPAALGRGLSMSLSPRWGAPAGGAGALWREELPRGAAPGATNAREAGGFKGELGCGFGLFGGRLTGTPNVGFGASDGGGRDYRLGWRLTPAGGGGFRVDLDATRRESANGTEPPAHGAMLTGAIRW